MKDKILEILIDKIKATPHDYYPTGIEGLPQSAREIADMARKFVEWMNEQDYYLYDEDKHTWVTDEPVAFSEECTFDELFTSWHKNIYNIKDKEI